MDNKNKNKCYKLPGPDMINRELKNNYVNSFSLRFDASSRPNTYQPNLNVFEVKMPDLNSTKPNMSLNHQINGNMLLLLKFVLIN